MYCENNLGTEEDVFETCLKNANLVQFSNDKILKATIQNKTNLYNSLADTLKILCNTKLKRIRKK